MRLIAALVAVALASLSAPAAAQNEPTGAHPRIVLDDALRARWKKLASDKDSAIGRAVKRCDQLRKNPKEFSRDLYMGLDWGQYLQSCLVAWAATGKDDHAKTAMVYFKAMLDDLDNVGDGKGGDQAAWRDSGFAIRAMGPYTALAYDWLHDHELMTEALRKKARQRFQSWTDWYLDKGYRARSPGTNYQAGYLIAATFIAIAQGGEAGKAGGRLWAHVVDDLWGKDMKKAFKPGGVLDGGDWSEGWQYAPLSIAEYSLAARAMADNGVTIDNLDHWFDGLIRHHVHALSPGGGVFVNGDTAIDSANIKPNYLSYAAIAIGDAPADAKAWALGEIADLGLPSDGFPIFECLVAGVDVEAKPVPRKDWPTTYLPRGSGTFYSRSHWGDAAVWMVTQCTSTIDVDHIHPNAGNVVLSRGRDDAIVDPSPYGTLSTMTSNAPTVESAQLPEDYKPSQAWWSLKTRYHWAMQTASGIIAARCDYADQYKFQENPSDVPEAVRDLVLVPYAKGDAGALVVIDRARSGDGKRDLYLRFRSEASLTLSGDVATGKDGSTQLTIRRVASSSGKPEVRSLETNHSPCFGEKDTRGGCDTPRFDVDEYRLTVDGPTMSALHVIDVAAPSKAAPVVTALSGVDGVVLARDGRNAVVVAGKGKELSYSAPATESSYHVIVGAPESGGKAAVAAELSGSDCTVTVTASGKGTQVSATPVVVVLDGSCKIAEDPQQTQPLPGTGGGSGSGDGSGTGDGSGAGDSSGTGTGTGNGGGDADGGGAGDPRSPRSGCCGAQTTPGSALFPGALVLLGLIAMRRRKRR